MILDRTRAGRQMRLARGSIHTFDVPPLVRALREEAVYLEHGRDGVTLVKSPGLRVVLEALMAGSRLDEHHADGPVTLYMLDGEVRLQTGEEVVYLRAGELLSMPAHCPHSLEAVRDSAFLLTIGAAETIGSDDLPDPEAVRRMARQVWRDWADAQERFGGEWPAEGGDEEC